uniref:Reverse transcriptase domain-containing protein n=1 Tax=Tanacetum cinerariifolium TaxID=118510 RepID=A0A699HUY7_TANCI|nr:hypothetical protein [Tanacetum cinerariifolium]
MQDDLLNQMRNFMQNLYDGPPGEDKEHEATTDTELLSTEDIQPLPVQEPPQNSHICQLIGEECCVEASEKQKQKMGDMMLELVKICQEKEFFVFMMISMISLVVHKSSTSFRDTPQISSIHAVAPILSTKEPEHLLKIGYERLSITPKMESNKVTEPNDENLLPIPSKCEVTLGDKKECDVPISENSPVYDNHSDIFSDSKIDDDISVYDDDFEDIEYVEASIYDPEIASVEEIVSVEEENVFQQEEEEVDFEDISQIQVVVLREKLLSIIRLISNTESLNENSTLDRVFNSFESDNSFLDNFSPEFETFCDHTEETESGNTTHANYTLLEYDSFCFEIEPDQERLINLMKNDIPDNSSNEPLLEEVDLFLSNNSIPSGEEIPVMMNDKDKDVDYFYSMFVIFDKMFSLLSAESEDTIFDPGISE